VKVYVPILTLLLTVTLNAQSYKVKAGAIGIPLFQSGAGMANISFEIYNKKANKSFQLTTSISAGAVAADAPGTTRKWITLERIFYTSKPDAKRKFFYTIFAEAGTRNISPGFTDFPPDSILNQKRAFEINPGVGFGINFKIKKKFGVDFSAGPKLIIASHKDKYYNSLSKQYFTVNYNDTRAGFRFITNLSYQF